MSGLSPSDNAREQVRDESAHPESSLAGDPENADLRHQTHAALGRCEAELYRFLDRPLPLDLVLHLGSMFLAEDAERVAEALDSLVSRGLLRFADGVVDRPRVMSRSELEAVGKKGPHPMDAVYAEWLELARAHPEWTMRFADDEATERLDLGDPVGSMQGLRGRVRYDESSVRPEDADDFKRFLDLDRRIEEFEAGGGYSPKASLRARALYRMAGGRVATIGAFRDGLRHVRAEGAQLGRGDLVQALAEEIAERDHACALHTLPQAEQMRIMQKAEEQSFDRFPLVTKADFGAPPDPSEQPPAPDPEKAPQGFEAIVGPDGKKTWRSKTDPNVKLERPDGTA